ncbi:MAG: HEAT repeat domain-containing protein [Bacteroides sp.]|nr:HEAT repeat domain-containing protein [Prevotella sp.]MCM1408228.1 HEAT repeat domain-containing protein [Treponema brennaborense]MCM1469552.1 HEAT repeat domain-containing protein [Bacteroides sp.]
MKFGKKAAVVIFIAGCVGFMPAQEQRTQRQEQSAEEKYLQEYQDIVIKELAYAPDKDSKLVALNYLKDAVESGNDSQAVVNALDSLAGEGTFTKSRTGGHVENDYPDIRAEACKLLGKVQAEDKKQQAKDILTKVALAENEPWVATNAIRALGEIGINNGDETVSTIAWTHRKYSMLNPTSSLALETLNAYEKLLPTIANKGPVIQSISSISTNYRYVPAVREKAQELLEKMTGKGSRK